MGVGDSRLGSAFALLFAGASALQAGCAHGSAATPAVVSPNDEEEQARIDELTRRNRELEEEMRQLRGQLALAQAEVRDLRASSSSAAASCASPRETVRIGSTTGATNDEGYAEPPLDATPPPRGAPSSGTAARAPQDARPVLRLYGSPALPLDGAGYITVRERLPPGPDVRPLPPSAQPAAVAVAPAAASPNAAAPAAVAPSAERPATAAPAGEDDPAQQAYRAALAHVTARRYREADEALTRFLQQFPRHPYTDNALYWRGTVAYAERRYTDALRDFERVVAEFPRGNKVPDALYQIGMCHLRTGDRDTARSYFRRVQAEYPNTVAARLASREDAS